MYKKVVDTQVHEIWHSPDMFVRNTTLAVNPKHRNAIYASNLPEDGEGARDEEKQ